MNHETLFWVTVSANVLAMLINLASVWYHTRCYTRKK